MTSHPPRSSSGAGRYARRIDGLLLIWDVARLWRKARDLPILERRIEDIEEFDQVTWFSGNDELPTCRKVASHVERILRADLGRPVILAEDGAVMDGMHRIAKAWIEDREAVLAVQFSRNPSPDEIVELFGGERRRLQERADRKTTFRGAERRRLLQERLRRQDPRRPSHPGKERE